MCNSNLPGVVSHLSVWVFIVFHMKTVLVSSFLQLFHCEGPLCLSGCATAGMVKVSQPGAGRELRTDEGSAKNT